MGILTWLLVGLVAGLIANALVPGKAPGGLIMTVLIGIGGAILGGFLAVALKVGTGVSGFDLHTIIIAVLGAIVLLFAYRALSGRNGLRI